MRSFLSRRLGSLGIGAVCAAVAGSLAFAPLAGAITGSPPAAPGISGLSSTTEIASGLSGAGDGLATDGLGHLFATSHGNIVRMNMDGSNKVTIASGFGTDSQFIRVGPDGKLWTGGWGSSSITEMGFDGSNKHVIATTIANPTDVAFDGFGHMYVCSESGGIWRTNLDGSNAVQIVASSGHDVWGLSYDHAGHLYFANGYAGDGYRVNLDGSGLSDIFGSATALEAVNVLADHHVIWSDYSGRQLIETDANGANPLVIAGGLDGPEVTIVTPGTIYFNSWSGGVYRTSFSPAAIPGVNSASVFWTPSVASDAPVISYTILAEPIGGGVTLEQTVAGNQTSTSFFGLLNGVQYQFQAYATNIFGDSALSSRSNEVTPGPQYPDAPNSPTVAALAGSAKVTWSAPNAHGSGVTAYVVAAYAGTSTAVATTRITVPGAATSAVVTGLTNGVAYRFTVMAINGIGVSTPSLPSTPVTVSGPPSWSSAPTATALSRAAKVSWSAANANGSPITGYRVIASPGTRTCVTAGALSCTVTGLAPGVTYRFKVVATNHRGSSPASPASNAVVARA